MHTEIGPDGRVRCAWCLPNPDYIAYHDTEWGRPVTDDRPLYEKVVLEGFQAGLSWLTVLRKRERFREVFAGFDPTVVAGYGDEDVARLLTDPGIIRHEGKIRSAINNARRALELGEETGSLAAFFWSYADPKPSDPPTEIPSETPTSRMLAADLKRRGWTFVGPTTVYAFMQAMGLKNDHLEECYVREACAKERQQVLSQVKLE